MFFSFSVSNLVDVIVVQHISNIAQGLFGSLGFCPEDEMVNFVPFPNLDQACLLDQLLVVCVHLVQL